MKKPLAVTAGEPAGIGYDILVQAAQRTRQQNYLVFADPKVLEARAGLLNLPLTIEGFKNFDEVTNEKQKLTVWATPCAAEVIPGKPDPRNAEAVLQCLTEAAEFCLNQKVSGLVTLPVHKAVINQAGFVFTGHTEFFATIAKVKKVVMMLASNHCRVALVTTHVPLRNVSDLITKENLSETLSILLEHLQRYEGIKKPRILVMGLNPHAGESGYLGREEIDIITPVLAKLNVDLNAEFIGPLSADTLFQPKYLEQADAIVAMYHDQGLTPLKALYFGEIANVTCGLGFVRTSVDHGVALDVVGTGRADMGSFLMAIKVAEKMMSDI